MTAIALKILRYEWNDIVRSKWILGYFGFFLLLTEGLFRFGGGSAKVLLSLMNLTLLMIPLMSIVFAVIYLYNAREFVELLLSQPIPRRALFRGLYSGLAIPFSGAYAAGVALPFLLHGVEQSEHRSLLFLLLGAGVLLTLIFLALGFRIAFGSDEKVRGLGAAILSWLLFAVLYDGLLLLLIYTLSGYPLEKPLIALSLLNPIDLARILLLLQFDVAALMGYTGAVFERFFGSGLGMAVSLTALAGWTILPLWLAWRRFRRKDF